MCPHIHLAVDLTGYRSPGSLVDLAPFPSLPRADVLALVQRCVAGSGDPELADLDGIAALRQVAGGPSAALTDPHFAAVVDGSGAPVGVTLPWVEGGVGRIALIGVVPEARGRGWASRILSTTLDRLVAMGAHTYAERVHRDNAAAIAVLAREGLLAGR